MALQNGFTGGQKRKKRAARKNLPLCTVGSTETPKNALYFARKDKTSQVILPR